MLQAYHQTELLEAGCDEAGRGCLAGPVVAAAVILPLDFYHPLLNDSKQLSESTRNTLAPVIRENAIAWAIGICDQTEIDKLNILRASFAAMHKAINQLSVRPQLLLIDGNRFHKYPGIPHLTMIKGDARFASIAAASILAKTVRDEMMQQLHVEYPVYNWSSNKGYPTSEHRDAIRIHGDTKYHRKTFRLLPEQERELFGG
ncbi:MAG TPA: ribonuclease HII [Chitinophagales bacterium]|nr:ribonuclease HII [Chitinophagales bacterium]HNA58141.1 ribonuclease HII [Chitinophagales bacterium]HNE47418.1 ribonuclease HII [Chitinophagales bacterium]HNF70503.1 ribonuclease HII [Chitinophagales bacterium]HNI55855.1 ribonuclease HII [Chitinophagales bacterium]